MAIAADIGEGLAHETEGFILGTLFQLVDPFDRLLVKDIATNPIHGIGGITDNPSETENIHYLFNQSCLRIDRIYLDYFCHLFRSLRVLVQQAHV